MPHSAIYAGIAQSVEQLIRNEQVAGSSPITSSKRTARFLCGVALHKRKNKVRDGEVRVPLPAPKRTAR